ncbi:hypothetical protein [Aeoliella sp.]|uniref:hypothetical protein n=1 Tax=Aeoliella sp. TaxID=2795800 RepID=UPI003CCBBBFC
MGTARAEYLAYLHEVAVQMVELERNWVAITAVAEALLQRTTLSRVEAIEVIEKAWGLPPLSASLKAKR